MSLEARQLTPNELRVDGLILTTRDALRHQASAALLPQDVREVLNSTSTFLPFPQQHPEQASVHSCRCFQHERA